MESGTVQTVKFPAESPMRRSFVVPPVVGEALENVATAVTGFVPGGELHELLVEPSCT